MATPTRQNKRILDMLVEILERLERLENGGNTATQADETKKPAAKKASK